MSTQSTDFSAQPLPPNAPSGSRAARRPRWWLPLTVALVAAAALAVVARVPLGDTEEVNRTMVMYAIFSLALVLVLGWLLAVKATRLITLVALLVVVVGTAAAFATGFLVVRYWGDMGFTVHLRNAWSARGQGDAKDLPAVDADNLTQLDCPEYRGRNRDGAVFGPELARDWSAQPPRQLWQHECGDGHSSYAIVGNVAVTLEQRGDQETVVCYDTDTGKQRWSRGYNAVFNEFLGGKGPRSTPTIAGGDVYALGATGQLHCLDVKTGAVKWRVDVLENNENVMWGLSGSPLVHGNLVVVNPGVQKAGAAGTLAAYDRATGRHVWSSGSGQAGYSSPMLVKLGGRDQIVLFDGDGVAGYDPADGGKELWRYPWETQQHINVAQPLDLGDDRLFVSSGYGVGCNVLQIRQAGDGWAVKPLWERKSNALRCKFTSPVLWEGLIYGLDDGVLACVDPATGKRKWRDGRYGHGQVRVTRGTLLVLGETGQLALVEATPEHYNELGRIQALEESRTWNVPVLVDGRVYVRNDQQMACYDLTKR
jgi:outer membrane protein assembly factor BamB